MTNYLSDLRLLMEWSDTNLQSSIYYYIKFVFLTLLGNTKPGDQAAGLAMARPR